tara:strand:- start:459 stop:623 length:165 start_codon:yes stop_codon:yes gene_type:complete
MKRYVVQIEKYVFAEDDEAVKKMLDEECSGTNGDVQCIQIVEQKFGTIGNRKVV